MSAARSEHEVSEIIDGLSEQEVSPPSRPERPGWWGARACHPGVGGTNRGGEAPGPKGRAGLRRRFRRAGRGSVPMPQGGSWGSVPRRLGPPATFLQCLPLTESRGQGPWAPGVQVGCLLPDLLCAWGPPWGALAVITGAQRRPRSGERRPLLLRKGWCRLGPSGSLGSSVRCASPPPPPHMQVPNVTTRAPWRRRGRGLAPGGGCPGRTCCCPGPTQQPVAVCAETGRNEVKLETQLPGHSRRVSKRGAAGSASGSHVGRAAGPPAGADGTAPAPDGSVGQPGALGRGVRCNC